MQRLRKEMRDGHYVELIWIDSQTDWISFRSILIWIHSQTDLISVGTILKRIESHLDRFSSDSNLKRIDCHHYYYYVLPRLTILLQLTRSLYPLILPLPSGRQVTSVVIFPPAYRTSRDILLEFRLFLHSHVCQIYRHERLWSANSLSKTWC